VKLFLKAFSSSKDTGLPESQAKAAPRSERGFLEGYSKVDLPLEHSVHVTISRLCEFLVGDHLVLDADKDLFKSVGGVPVGEHMELVLLYHAVVLVHAGNVNLRCELDLGRSSWVVLATGDIEHINAVVEVGVGGTDDRAIPVRERFVVA